MLHDCSGISAHRRGRRGLRGRAGARRHAALAQALGIDPAPDRGRFIYEIARLLYNTPEGREPTADAFLQPLRQRRAPARRCRLERRGRRRSVPVPLTADVWSNAIFHRTRRAATSWSPRSSPTAPRRCCAIGLAALDDGRCSTSPIIRRCSSGSTSARRRPSPRSSSSLRVRPTASFRRAGGARRRRCALWEAVVGRKGDARGSLHPAAVRAERRPARVLSTTPSAQLDPPRRAFALGLWMPDAAARADRFKALATSGIGAFRECAHAHAAVRPRLLRPVDDAGAGRGRRRRRACRAGVARLLVARVRRHAICRTTRRGRCAASRRSRSTRRGWPRRSARPTCAQRAERLDQIAFGQRVFGGGAPPARSRRRLRRACARSRATGC